MSSQRAAAREVKQSSALKPQSTRASVSRKTEKEANWLNRLVQAYVGNIGDHASGLIYGAGDAVNKAGSNVGRSVTEKTRSWGQGVAEYGNGIKDATGAGGPRALTASNPLGLAGGGPKLNALATSGKGKSTAKNPLGL